MEILTKANFWDGIEKKYPSEFIQFAEWIDKYKAENHWKDLFPSDIKFHQLPAAMQLGIFIQYTIDESHWFKMQIGDTEMYERGDIPKVIEEWITYEEDETREDHFQGKYVNDEYEHDNLEE